MRQKASSGQRWGAKHPSLCLAVPNLYNVLGSEWFAVRVLRDVNSVVKSLDRVGWWGNAKNLRKLTTELLFQTRDEDLFRHKSQYKVDLRYEDLTDDPDSAVRMLNERLHLDATTAQIASAVSLVRPPKSQVAVKKPQKKPESKPVGRSTAMPPIFTYWTGPKPVWIEMCLETLRKHDPVEVLSQEQFMDLWTVNTDVKDKFLKLMPNQQSDFVRSYLLAHRGGMWIDADCISFRALEPFRKLAQHKLLVYSEYDRNPRKLCSAFIGTPPRHPAMVEYHRIHLRKLQTQERIQSRIGLGPITLRNAVKRSKIPVGLVSRRHVMPIHFGVKKKFFIERSDGEHAKEFQRDCFTYMLTHATGERFGDKTRGEIMRSKTMLGFLFRQAYEDKTTETCQPLCNPDVALSVEETLIQPA